MSLLTAAVKMTNGEIDAGSIKIICLAFDDLISRGYSRSEIEAVFRRIKRRIVPPRHIPDDTKRRHVTISGDV
jgi:hypothetical protein